MLNKTSVNVVLLLSATLLTAGGAFFWWNEGVSPDTSQLVSVPRRGTMKALVLVVEFPDDSADYGDGTLPAYCDSLIAPAFNQKDDSLYMWSVTNFFAAASWDTFKMIGFVNPGFDTHYIVAPNPLDTYQVVGGVDKLEDDIVELADDSIDYSLYDEDDDGYVD